MTKTISSHERQCPRDKGFPGIFTPLVIAAITLSAPADCLAQSPSDNYVRSTAMLDSTGSHRQVSVDYYDGMGRPVQHVGESPVSGRTVHVGRLYDALGRLSDETQPAALEQDGHGQVTDTALGGILATQYGDPMARTQHNYDALGRETSTRGPGVAWTQHPSTKAYGVNEVNEIRRFTVSGGRLYASGFYPLGSLAKETVADEDGLMRIVFTDLAGNMVMEQNGGSGSLLITRYVYDSCDRLCYVLPCAALEGLEGNGPWDASTPSIDRFAYVYEYDGHGRVTGRKMPGCTMRHTWYDRHGHVAYEDDGNLQAAGRRRFFLYETFNRMVVSGTCAASTAPDLTWREAKALASSIGNTYGSYSTNVLLDSVELHEINYYDSHTYVTFGLGDGCQWLTFTPTQDIPAHASAKGLMTGRRVFTLGSSECEASSFYYDAKGRMVQRKSLGAHLGQEAEYISYTFTGKPSSRRHTLTPPAGMAVDETYSYTYNDRTEDLLTVAHSVNGSAPVTLAAYTYDAIGRTATKAIGGIETVSYTYNMRSWPTKVQSAKFTELLAYNEAEGGITPSTPQWSGRIAAQRWYHGNPTIKPLYQFAYDTAGRLTSATYSQNVYMQGRRPKYSENFAYDAMGNITSLTRQGFLYSATWGDIDDLVMEYEGNRMVKCDDAAASQPTYSEAHHFADLADTTTEYEYDQNGNMTKDLNRNISSIHYNSLNLPEKTIILGDGMRTYIDNTYDASGNKLRTTVGRQMTIGPIRPSSLGGGAEPQGGGLSGGLPGGLVNPIPSSNIITTDYRGNAIYRGDTLSMLLTEEGYVTFTNDTTPVYHYYLKDHLGSVRVVFDQSGTVEQRNDYYPSGTLMYTSTNGTLQPYKFGGKELERTAGLDEYDFGARWMDPVIGGRFTTMDPLAEKYYGISPYAYCGGDPVNAVDPDGERIFMLFYTIGNDHGDDSFKDAALTRKYDIEHSKDFNKNEDIVVMCGICDLGTLSGTVDKIVGNFSEKYGKTAEFSIWSHSGIDGPRGGVETSSYPKDKTQLSLEGWSKIDFNWDDQATANFYGCNSGTDPGEGRYSFVTNLSSLDNFRDVDVFGQTSFAYPSEYTDVRSTTFQMALGIRSFPTYYVGGRRKEGISSFFLTVPAIPMVKSRNGINSKGKYIQKGRKSN